jgi:hypothetical protein
MEQTQVPPAGRYALHFYHGHRRAVCVFRNRARVWSHHLARSNARRQAIAEQS